MKKLILSLATALLLFIILPSQLKADNVTNQVTMPAAKSPAAAEAGVLLARLDKIDAMDKSDMSFSEKRKLRKEVKSINSQLKTLDGGVYLSVGAIIIIILLLILLL